MLQAAAIVTDESMNHDLTDDPISSLPQRRYDFVKSAAQINLQADVLSQRLSVFVKCYAHVFHLQFVSCRDAVICGELLEEIQKLPVTRGGVTERESVCVTESCPEDSPRSGGQEGDAVMMNPPTLTKREFTFFATCGENCSKQELKIPR